jgi:hypothetical protein
MSTEEFAPGRPESVEITKPATLPCNASIALALGVSAISFPFTVATEATVRLATFLPP